MKTSPEMKKMMTSSVKNRKKNFQKKPLPTMIRTTNSSLDPDRETAIFEEELRLSKIGFFSKIVSVNSSKQTATSKSMQITL